MASYPWSTKIQAYLAKIAGKDVDNLPEPTTKEQALLKEIAEGGGSSGGGGDFVTINIGAFDEDTHEVTEADKTPEEIRSALDAGKLVVVRWESYPGKRMALAQDDSDGVYVRLVGSYACYGLAGPNNYYDVKAPTAFELSANDEDSAWMFNPYANT